MLLFATHTARLQPQNPAKRWRGCDGDGLKLPVFEYWGRAGKRQETGGPNMVKVERNFQGNILFPFIG